MIPPYKGAPLNKMVNIELGNAKKYQLYNLKDDISQQNNQAISNPEKLQKMISAFETLRGTDYKNTQKLELK